MSYLVDQIFVLNKTTSKCIYIIMKASLIFLLMFNINSSVIELDIGYFYRKNLIMSIIVTIIGLLFKFNFWLSKGQWLSNKTPSIYLRLYVVYLFLREKDICERKFRWCNF